MKKHIVSGLLMLSIITPVAVFAQTEVDPNGPVSSCISLQNNLRYQSRDTTTNGEVSTLQDFLQTRGYLNTEPTGYFGLLTKAAAQSFQSANGISGDGYVGPVTRAKIKALSCGVELNDAVPFTSTSNGCGRGGIFSSTTGERCPTTNFKNGCTSTSGFSSTTGEPCGNNPNLPDGCNSTLGFSSTTGEYCDGSHTPQAPTPFALPKVTLSASSSSITTGQSVTLSWASTNTSSCLGPTNVKNSSTSGSVSVTPTQTTNYSVTCYGADSFNSLSASSSVMVYVNPAINTCTSSGFDSTTGFPCGCSSTSGFSTTTGQWCGGTTTASPTVDLKVNGSDGPITVNPNETFTLSWTSINADSCEGTGKAGGPNWWNGAKTTSGTLTGSVMQNETIEIICQNSSGVQASDDVSVNISANNPYPFSVLFPTSGATLIKGQTYKITWSGWNNDPSGNHINSYAVYLVGGNLGSTGSMYLGSVDLNSDNWFSWTVPSDVAPGPGYQIQFSDAYATGDNSDSFNIAVPSTSLPTGCTSHDGWSTTTGQACNGTN